MTTAPHDLRCEYQLDPLGIDEPLPRLGWKLRGAGESAYQLAYRIQAAATPEALEAGAADVWDSGKVVSGDSHANVWGGGPLVSRQRVYWRVCIWDGAQRLSAWSATAWFEMGLLERGDWQTQWIGHPAHGSHWQAAPVPLVRQTFALQAPVRSARLYITALGVYEAYLNGVPVSEARFTPGWTNYLRRVEYRVFDVGSLLRVGSNALGALLGDGWFCGRIFNLGRQNYGDRPLLCARLEVNLADGSGVTVVTDGSWRSRTGPILASDIMMGEDYDARQELGPWQLPEYDDSAWSLVWVAADPDALLSAATTPPVRQIEVLAPVADPVRFETLNTTHYVFDLGQNMTGHARIRLRHRRGAAVTIRHAESLDPQGRPFYGNLGVAAATDTYTFGTDGEETWEPRFTFHGFRYVELTFDAAPAPNLDRSALTGVVVHSDLERIGEFSCSHELINRLQSNIVWSQRGNFLDIPTDCPQRSERLGWSGDVLVFCATAGFNLHTGAFFERYMRNLREAQHRNGSLPPVFPHYKPRDYLIDEMDSGPAWSDVVVELPWMLYRTYGDTRVLERNYEAMVRYLDHVATICVDDVRSHPDRGWGGYGDWLSAGPNTAQDLIGTAYHVRSASLMARIAGLLGKSADAAQYAALAQRLTGVFRRRFLNEQGLLRSPTQTGWVLALHFGLIPEADRAAAVVALVQDIESRGDTLSTGFVGTPLLCRVLSDHGRTEVAYRLLEQTQCPSWLFPVTQGATTMWEQWDAWSREKGHVGGSLNHYAFGAVGMWLYAVVAGLDADPEIPGYKRILFRPTPGGSLTRAAAALETPYGRASIAWEIEGRELRVRCEVPANTTARLIPPANYRAASGTQSADGIELLPGLTQTLWQRGDS